MIEKIIIWRNSSLSQDSGNFHKLNSKKYELTFIKAQNTKRKKARGNESKCQQNQTYKDFRYRNHQTACKRNMFYTFKDLKQEDF